MSTPSSIPPHSSLKRTAGELCKDLLWDAFCTASLVGIWPRFIEPKILTTTVVTLKIKELPEALNGLKILHFSDLHLHSRVPTHFLEKLIKKSAAFAPDLVFFTGDFISLSKLDDPARLEAFLKAFPRGKYGSYCILGNHDYEQFVTIDRFGVYGINNTIQSPVVKGFKLLFRPQHPPSSMKLEVTKIPPKKELIEIIKKTPFHLLHNETVQVKIEGSTLNICGLGEYSLGRCLIDEAYKNYDLSAPGIILTHNPDSIPLLNEKPGSLILSGHTHGGQVNLPIIRKKFLVMENPQYKRGVIRLQERWAVITRGVGSVLPFRWFAPPELVCLTLTAS